MTTPEELEQQIAELKAENNKLRIRINDYDSSWKATRKKLEGPSLKKMLATRYNTIDSIAGKQEFSNHPLLNIPQKLRIYEFAASHGIQTPKIYKSYLHLNEVDLDELPDKFVLKSDGGASSEGVLPLRRIGKDSYQRVDGHKTFTGEEVIDFFRQAQKKGTAYGVFFAEELLEQTDGNPIPDDIKIYTMFDAVSHVHLRRVDEHGSVGRSRSRYLSADKEDLGDINPLHAIDSSVPIPDNFDELCEIALHLTRAIGLSFVRIDLYNTTRGIVLGEITRGPGPASMYIAPFDAEVGKKWLIAEARQTLEYQAGRPVGNLWGDQEYLNLYPAHSEYARQNRLLKKISCSDWCKAPGYHSL
ncbi:ATP-grasp fold amidoligase family protein [Rothia terrae]|uniref:ATP-grasp fold amidoligase family protein n=1 Tax=Rothia terrae TaxID=396015 RepID=UPI0033DD80FF